MKALKAIAALLLLAGVSLGQENSGRREAVVKGMIGFMEKLTRTLKTVQDEDTAKAVRPELKKSADEWTALRKLAENIPPPTKEEKEKDGLAKEYRGKLEEAHKKLLAEIARVSLLPGGNDALTEVRKILTAKE